MNENEELKEEQNQGQNPVQNPGQGQNEYNEQMVAMQREMAAMRATIERLQGQPVQQGQPMQPQAPQGQPRPMQMQQVPPYQAPPAQPRPQPQMSKPQMNPMQYYVPGVYSGQAQGQIRPQGQQMQPQAPQGQPMPQQGQPVQPRQIPPQMQQSPQQAQPVYGQQPAPQPRPVQQPSYVQQIQQGQPTYGQQPVSQPRQMQPQQIPPQAYIQPMMQPPVQKKHKNLEVDIGTIVMGIVASVLILIGLTLFAVAIWGDIDEIIKIIMMFAVSVAILTVGLIGYIKSKNGFFTSVTGCGVGAMYISLFTTYGYFEMMNPYVLFAILAVFTVGVFFIGRKKSIVFKVIGEVAILVSACFGVYIMGQIEGESDSFTIYMVMTAFVIVLSVFYTEMNRTKGLLHNLPGITLSFISAVVLSFISGYHFQMPEVTAVISLSVWSLFFLYLAFAYVRRIEKENKNTGVSAIYAVFVMLLLLINMIMLFNSSDADPVSIYILMAIFHIGLWGITEMRRKKDIVRGISVVMILVLLLAAVASFGSFFEVLGVGIVALPVILLGYLMKDKFYIVISFILLILFGLETDTEYQSKFFFLVLIIWSVCIIAQLLFLSIMKQVYHCAWKILSYLSILVFMFRAVRELPAITDLSVMMAFAYMYGLMVILTILVLLTPFSKSWIQAGERENPVVITAAAVNAVLLITGIVLQFLPLSVIPHICVMVFLVVAAVTFLLPIYAVYGKHTGFAIYNGMKFILISLCIVLGWQGEGYLISVLWLILAVVFVGLGFGWKKQGVRIFGLVLSLICICKLLIFDIRYDNSILRATSFIICGVLCFGINLIYIIADKNMKKAEKAAGQIGEQ